MNAWLTPAARDTFVFHSDSIPDTLKTKTSFQSFYSPATKLEYKTSPIDETEDSLSFLPKEPSLITIDSMKTPEPAVTPDST